MASEPLPAGAPAVDNLHPPLHPTPTRDPGPRTERWAAWLLAGLGTLPQDQ